MIKYTIDSSIESYLLHIYNQTGINTGDITPEQGERLDRLETELAKLLVELIRGNATDRIFYDFERDRFYSRSQLLEEYTSGDLATQCETFTEYLNACTDKDGTLEEVTR
jgi:hypothetical protein